MSALFFSCQYCSHIVNRRAYIYRHIIKNHSDHLPFYCETCGKPFPGRHELSAHVKYSHRKPRKTPFYPFSMHSRLDSCSDEEADEEAIKLLIDCDKMQTRSSKHSRCWKCNVKISSKVGLGDHIMLVHYGMKNYRCESCNKSFEMTAILKKHMAECHDSLLSYPCRYCMDNSFPTKTQLFQHYSGMHPNNPAVQFFRGTDSTMFLKYIQSLIMEGAKNNFTVYVPVITRCSEASAKLAEYNKAIIADNVACIFSTLGFVDYTNSDTNSTDQPDMNISAVSGPIAISSPSVCDQLYDLGEAPTNPQSTINVPAVSTPAAILSEDAESTLPVTCIKLEPADPDNFEAADAEIKLEPIDCHEGCSDMAVDLDLQKVKHEPYSDDTLRSVDDTLCSVDDTLRSVDDTLRSVDDTSRSVDDTLSSVDDNRTVNEKVKSPSTHQVDFTDNHLSEASSSDEMVGKTKSRQARSRRPQISKDSLYKLSDDEQEDPMDMDTDVEDGDDEEIAMGVMKGVLSKKVNYGFRVLKKCTYCENICLAKLMAVHIREKHGGKEIKHKYTETGFQCQLCPFKTSWRKSLKDHVLALHTPDAAVHQCNQCDYSTRLAKNLTHHVKMKHGGKRFFCSQCSTSATNITDLKDHVAVKHEGRLRHKCKLCSFTAGYRSAMFIHVKKFHKCTQCKYMHNDQSEVARHVAEEHGLVYNPSEIIKKRIRKKKLSEPVSTKQRVVKRKTKQPVRSKTELTNGVTEVLCYKPQFFDQMSIPADQQQRTLDSRVDNDSNTLSPEDQRVQDKGNISESKELTSAAKIINESHNVELLPTAIREDLEPEPYHCL